MSRKANACDNAPMESFFKARKVERIHQLRYRHAEAGQAGHRQLDRRLVQPPAPALGQRLPAPSDQRELPLGCMT